MGMKIDGIATNGQLDSSGEILDVVGHDISDLQRGKGVINWEHSKSSEDIIGAVIYAKKIFSEKDCENARQRIYWEIANHVPFVYIIGELYDSEEHPGAVAAAAMIRYYAKHKEPLLVGFSIEGITLKRDGNILKQSVGRRVAMTLQPANKSCVAGLLDDPELREVVQKSENSIRANKSLYTIDSIIVDDNLESLKNVLVNNLKQSLLELRKTLTAGGATAASASRVGGSALSAEQAAIRHRVKLALRDWDRVRPLREFLKAALPDLSDEYIDYFADLAQKLFIKN